MGNKQSNSTVPSKYNETIDDKGFSEFFQKLKKHSGNQYVNFQSFVTIISSKFQFVPLILVECLYRGFGKNVNKMLLKTQFIALLSVLQIDSDRSISMDFLFKAYDVRQCGYIEYEYVYEILLLAYGEKKEEEIKTSLKDIFKKAGDKDGRIAKKRFKRFTGDLTILTDWVQVILSSLTEPIRNFNLFMLNHERYKLNMCARQVKVPYYIIMNMQKRYQKICRGNSSLNLKLMYDFLFNETTSNTLMLSPMLFIILYLTKKVKYGMVWNIFDYFEFCIVFSNFYNDNNTVIKSLVGIFHDHISANVLKYSYHGESDVNKVKLNVMKILLITSFPNKNVIDDELLFIKTNIDLQDRNGDDIVRLIYLYYTESYDYDKIPKEVRHEINRFECETALNDTVTFDPNDKSFYCNLFKTFSVAKNLSFYNAFSELMLVACVFLGIRPRFVSLEKSLIQTIIERQNECFQGTWMSLGPVGTVWSVIDKEWYLAWQANNLAVWSIPISNAMLLHKHAELLPSLIYGSHYDVIPIHAFLGLHAWYLGGPMIARKVILNSSQIFEIEIYPVVLYVFLYGEDAIFTIYTISKMSSIKQLLIDLCKLKNVDISCGRLWIKNSTMQQRLLSIDISIDDAGFCNYQHLLFETPHSNGKWPSSEVNKSMKQEIESDEKNEKVNDRMTSQINSGGFHVGFVNLGKTCYLNASLQALLHTKPIRDYFLSLEYIKDLNKSNSIQSDCLGLLSSEIADLIILVRTKSNIKSIKPNALVRQLYRINSEFSLDKQEDVHEFLGLLINHLSQDLNNASKYFQDRKLELISSDESDETLSIISAFANLSNESSFIQYLFTGQFKSTIYCPDNVHCSYESKQFESFNTLQLPLGVTNYRLLHVFIMALNSSKVYGLFIHIDENATISTVIDQIIVENPSLLTRNIIRKESVFLAADITKSNVNALLRNKTKVVHITYDLMLFEITGDEYTKTSKLSYRKCPAYDQPFKKSNFIRIIFNQRKVTMMNDSIFDSLKIEAIGFPFLEIIHTNVTTPTMLYELISKKVAPYIECDITANKIENDTNDTKNNTSDDAIFGGFMNKYGFTLRVTKGGVCDDFISCPKCPWLNRCYGCFILNPMDSENLIILEDGDNISVDWNYLLFENSYDLHTASTAIPINNTNSIKYYPSQTIEDCLDKFIEVENINGSICSKCSKVSLQKSLTIYKFPPILLVQLQRFYFDGLQHEKNNKLIIFPLSNFDVSKYLPRNYVNEEKNGHIYDLYCVVNHVGSLSSGHYYSFNKNMETNEWFNFNDDVVSKLKDEEVITPAAYLLFYIRRDIVSKSYAQIVDQRLHEISEVLKNTEEMCTKEIVKNVTKNGYENKSQPHVEAHVEVSPGGMRNTKASKLALSRKYGRPDQEDCTIV